MLCLATHIPSEGIGEDEVQVAVINSSPNISAMLNLLPCRNPVSSELPTEQRKDHSLMTLIDYLQKGTLPQDKKQARTIAAKAPNYCIVNGVLYFINNKRRKWRIMEECHGGPLFR